MQYNIKISGNGNREQIAVRLIDLARAMQTTEEGEDIDLIHHNLTDDGVLKIKVSPELIYQT